MPKTNTKTNSKTTKSARTTQKLVSRPAETHIAREVVIPDEYRPIGMWGYFGYTILFNVPVVGWIICLCLAFGASNRNLRNFARSQFCWIILYVVALVLLTSLGVLQSLISGQFTTL